MDIRSRTVFLGYDRTIAHIEFTEKVTTCARPEPYHIRAWEGAHKVPHVAEKFWQLIASGGYKVSFLQ